MWRPGARLHDALHEKGMAAACSLAAAVTFVRWQGLCLAASQTASRLLQGGAQSEVTLLQ